MISLLLLVVLLWVAGYAGTRAAPEQALTIVTPTRHAGRASGSTLADIPAIEAAQPANDIAESIRETPTVQSYSAAGDERARQSRATGRPVDSRTTEDDFEPRGVPQPSRAAQVGDAGLQAAPSPTRPITSLSRQVPVDLSAVPATRPVTAIPARVITAGKPEAAPAKPSATPSPEPTPTAEATATPQGTPTPYATPASVPPADVQAINGVPLDQIVVLPDGTRAHVREIFAQGQQLGRDARSFAKVGDSTMFWPPLLAHFDYAGGYNLGPYAYLQPAVGYFTGHFANASAAVKPGMHSWGEFDPSWVAGDRCETGEGPLACELRLANPSIAIIRLGANDYLMPWDYERNMRRIVELCLAKGIVPILGTKPDRSEGPQNTINGIVYALAAEYGIPLWDYDRVAATVPDRGLERDGIHFKLGTTHDYTTAQAYNQGDPLEDLSALMALDQVRRTTAGN